MKKIASTFFAMMAAVSTAQALDHKPEYSANVPPSITTPESVQTRIGTLKFFDGLPDDETVRKAYDQLDFSRGIEAFLSGIPAASLHAMCRGLNQAGVTPNKAIGITEDLMDARSLFLTPNSTTVYNFFCVDLKNGPVVVEIPPEALGPVDDAYFRFVTDVGLTGPDKGKGGKYLLVPPDYKGELPKEGYYIARTPTYINWLLCRVFVKDNDVGAAVKLVKARARGGNSLGRALRRRPYPVTKRDKIGTGAHQRPHVILAGGVSDAWNFEQIRPPGQAFLQVFEARPAAVAVGFAEHDVIGSSLAGEHGIMTAAQAAGTGNPLRLEQRERRGEPVNAAQMRPVGAGARHDFGTVVEDKRDVARLHHGGNMLNPFDQCPLAAIGKAQEHRGDVAGA